MMFTVVNHCLGMLVDRVRLFYIRAKGGYRVIDYGKNNTVVIGNNNIMSDFSISFRGDNNTVKIGDDCVLSNACFQLIDDNNSIIVSNGQRWGEDISVVVEEGTNITIGSNCQLAVGVSFRSSDGHSIISEKSNQRINPAMDIIVGDRCWLGENSKVLKGASIGTDCVIAAGAILTKGKYDDNSIYAGVPAIKVKNGIRWVKERI